MKAGKDNTDVKTLHSNASQTVFKLQYQHVPLLPSISNLLYLLSSVLGTEETGKTPLRPRLHIFYFHLTPIKILATLYSYKTYT